MGKKHFNSGLWGLLFAVPAVEDLTCTHFAPWRAPKSYLRAAVGRGSQYMCQMCVH